MRSLTEVAQVIIYSHGFGVRSSNRGLFDAIAKAVPEAQHSSFDYNPVHDQSNTLTAKTFAEQALKLRKVINNARAEYPKAVIDIVCHGEGCVIAGLVKPRDIRKIILLSPAWDVRPGSFMAQLRAAQDDPIDPAVRTRLTGSNGSTIVIHPEFWQGLQGIDPPKLYNRLARFTGLRIIHAKQDEVYGLSDTSLIDPAISMISLNGNHYFEAADDRQRLLYILHKELAVT